VISEFTTTFGINFFSEFYLNFDSDSQNKFRQFRIFEIFCLYIGWKSRSGKKRLNSIKIPAVIIIQTAAKTGAVDRYLSKSCMNQSPERDYKISHFGNNVKNTVWGKLVILISL
jgi:hypothetical protein